MEKNKKQLRSALTKQNILRVAANLFYQHGINNVGIDRIIAESDIAKMTFYNHFPSKEALVVEYLKETEAKALENYRLRLNGINDPQKRLLAFFDLLQEWFETKDFRGCNFINATAEAGSEPLRQVEVSCKYKNAVTDLLTTIAGEAGLKNPGKLGEQLSFLADGATVRAQMNHTSRPATLAKEAAKVLIRQACPK